jgi:phage anti-repressor protein
MEKLDIVNLIETNPITKLSNTFNNKLLNKIKEQFTDSQQHLFVSSFYCYLNYNQTIDFVIDLDNIWQWLGFSQKVRAKELLEKHFIINIDYKNLTQQVREKKTNGGNNKETIMLNIKTFKLFCIKASTKKANEIHEYFIKLEELLQDIIQEESDGLKLQLEQKNLEIQNNKEEFITKVQQEKQQFLLREFGSIGAIVYIIKVKSYKTGEYVIKIGESRKGIASRYNEHKSSYDEVLLLDCFMCKRSKEFENFLHGHEKIKHNRVTDLLNHENERELFLIGKNLSYKTLLDIINRNIKHYNEFDFEKIYQEIESIKQLITLPVINNNDNSLLQELVNINKLLLNKVENLEKSNQNLEKSNKEILEKLNSNQIKTTTGFNEPLPTIGSRLQQINPDTMQLVKVFETVSECLKINSYYKRVSLDKAVRENTIYHGFRWLYVDRELDSNTIYSIAPTKQTRIQHNDFIVKLNQEKTDILNIYLDRKSASILNSYKSDSSLDEPVKSGSLYKGYYYLLYNDCSNELKNNFIEKNDGEPILYKDGIGQYDSDNKLIGEFTCKNNCCKNVGISDKSLRKALEKNIMYNNYYYKHLGSKLQIYNIEPTNSNIVNTTLVSTLIIKPIMPTNFSICHIGEKDHIQFSKRINNKLYSYKAVIKSYDLQKELDTFVNYIKTEYKLNIADQKIIQLNNWKTTNKIK